MRPIYKEEIAQVLYDTCWMNLDDAKAVLNFETFKKIVLQSGLVTTIQTIKAKWLAIGGLPSFEFIEGRECYLVDIAQLRRDLHIPVPGDYIIKEAE